jgi:transposase
LSIQAKDCEKKVKKQLHSAKAKALNEYIVVVTSLPAAITAEQVLETYRLRWQAEIQFKRMKSILDFGEMPKRRSAGARTWLNGKLMLALIIEHVISAAFPPEEQLMSIKEFVARNKMVEADFDDKCFGP